MSNPYTGKENLPPSSYGKMKPISFLFGQSVKARYQNVFMTQYENSVDRFGGGGGGNEGRMVASSQV